MVNVVCDCGTTKTVGLNDIRSEKTTSCGCYRNQRIIETVTTHDLSKTVEYRAWWDMIARCTKEDHPYYSEYGGRGIKVFDRWLMSVVSFLEDVGKRPLDAECIDRVNNDEGYFPGNVRWTTHTINSMNKKSSKYWFVNGVKYDSCKLAAIANKVSISTVKVWCTGMVNHRSGKFYPPKKGCYSEQKYTS
jgi:hypothetical protein